MPAIARSVCRLDIQIQRTQPHSSYAVAGWTPNSGGALPHSRGPITACRAGRLFELIRCGFAFSAQASISDEGTLTLGRRSDPSSISVARNQGSERLRSSSHVGSLSPIRHQFSSQPGIAGGRLVSGRLIFNRGSRSVTLADRELAAARAADYAGWRQQVGLSSAACAKPRASTTSNIVTKPAQVCRSAPVATFRDVLSGRRGRAQGPRASDHSIGYYRRVSTCARGARQDEI